MIASPNFSLPKNLFFLEIFLSKIKKNAIIWHNLKAKFKS